MASSSPMEESIRIGLNGFGRIGRSVTRASLTHPGIDVVGINDIMENDDMRYLFAHDSVMGRFPNVALDGDDLVVDGHRIRLLHERSPETLPWASLDVDVTLECTGVFRTYEEASRHLSAGAEKVLISAPPRGETHVPQIVYGANHERYAGEDVISNASCTTNSVAPVVNVLDQAFGIDRGLLTTVHAYTGTQELIDGPSGKRRRGRAAAENIVPTTTGAARATTEVLPELEGKLDGMAMRVPVPNGSISDLTLSLDDDVDRDAVNEALEDAAANELAGVLGCTSEEIVSRDVIGLPFSSLVDLQSTMSMPGGLTKVLAWYDNEFGFAHRMLDVAELMMTGEATPERTAVATAH